MIAVALIAITYFSVFVLGVCTTVSTARSRDWDLFVGSGIQTLVWLAVGALVIGI